MGASTAATLSISQDSQRHVPQKRMEYDVAAYQRKLTPRQKALFELLRRKAGNEVTTDEILETTGWKATVWRTYCNNGFYAPFLYEATPRKYLVTMRRDLSESDFQRQVTQSKRDGDFKNRLAQALAKRSTENFILALETYNRPSLANRLDAFALLFTTAWEQLLKAEIVEGRGDEAIFTPIKPDRRRESIGLADCLKQQFPDPKDPVRLNIEHIAELRHEAAHLVMQELQPVYSHLFQSGVFNYARRCHARTGRSVVPRHNVGLLALAAEPDQLDVAPLARSYGQIVANDIVAQSRTLREEIQRVDDERFAIPVEYSMRFSKKTEAADVTLAQAAEAPLTATVFTKYVDPEKDFPLRPTQLLAAVHSELRKPFSRHDLQAVLFKEGWKQSDNTYHRLQRNPDTNKFSLRAVTEIVNKLRSDAAYLPRALESYNHHLKQRRGRRPRKKRQA